MQDTNRGSEEINIFNFFQNFIDYLIIILYISKSKNFEVVQGFAGIAQSEEQLTCNQQVVGSIPSASSITRFENPAN